MQKFSAYNEQQEINEAMMKLLVAMSFQPSLNESLDEGKIADFAGKLGLHISKENGLIDYVRKFTVASGKLLFAAIKGDTEKVKEISSGMKKEEFVDFLLKLDMATMHLVTGPIHMINAITGWELAPNIKHGAHAVKDAVVKSFKDALDYIKNKIDNFMAPGEKKDEMETHVVTLQKLADPALLAV